MNALAEFCQWRDGDMACLVGHGFREVPTERNDVTSWYNHQLGATPPPPVGIILPTIIQ